MMKHNPESNEGKLIRKLMRSTGKKFNILTIEDIEFLESTETRDEQYLTNLPPDEGG